MVYTFDIINVDYLIKKIHSLKYYRSTAPGWTEIAIRNSEFVARTQFRLKFFLSFFQLYKPEAFRKLYKRILRQRPLLDIEQQGCVGLI